MMKSMHASLTAISLQLHDGYFPTHWLVIWQLQQRPRKIPTADWQCDP